MSLHVLVEMVTSTKPSRTESTDKLSFTSMGSFMPRKFIWSSKLSTTTLPITGIRFFTCMGSNMGLQMGTLEVGLITASKSAVMRLHSACRCTGRILCCSLLLLKSSIWSRAGVWRSSFYEAWCGIEGKGMEIERTAKVLGQWIGGFIYFCTSIMRRGL